MPGRFSSALTNSHSTVSPGSRWMRAVAAFRSLPDGVPCGIGVRTFDGSQGRTSGQGCLLHRVGAGQDIVKTLLAAVAQFEGGRGLDIVQEGEGAVGTGCDLLLDDHAAAGLVGVGAAHRLARVQVDRGRARGYFTRGGDAVGIAVRTGQPGERIAGRRLLGDGVLLPPAG